MKALMETKIIKGSLEYENKTVRGWGFMVWYNQRPTASVVSALYRLKREAQAALNDFILTEHLDIYGTAEK